jgi:hypothetical protein
MNTPEKPLGPVSWLLGVAFRQERKGAKVGTVNRELAALSHQFNKGIEWGWIDKRPDKINRFPEERGRITYLTVDQIKRLIDGAKQDQNPQVYPYYRQELPGSFLLLQRKVGTR